MRTKVQDIALEPVGDKFWIVVYFDDGTSWVPKLTEWAKIGSGIGKAETRKYPNGKGWMMVKEFMDDCWNKTREEIEKIYISKYDPKGTTKESKTLIDAIANKGWNA